MSAVLGTGAGDEPGDREHRRASVRDDVVITPMRRRDIRSVLRIDGQVYPRPWTAGMYLGELANKGTRSYVVARSGQRVVGYAGLMLVVDEGHVTTVAVDPSWQRQSIAARMLLVLCRRGVAIGSTALTLEVRVSNIAAQSLYRRFGFVPAGIRKNYYPATNEDALVMWATDADEPEYRDRLARIEAELNVPFVVEGFFEQLDDADAGSNASDTNASDTDVEST